MCVFWGVKSVNAIELDILQHLIKNSLYKLEIFRQRRLRIFILIIEIATCRLKVFGHPSFTSGIFTSNPFSLKKENLF